MEPPARFDANLVRDEKVKVLQAVQPWTSESIAQNTLRGQYDGYLNTEGIAPGSRTATFAAIKLWIDNWRWDGVPFMIRTGKALARACGLIK
mgnify:CR=1 FL=1